MKEFVEKVRAAVEAHPVEALGVALGALTMLNALSQSLTDRKNAKTWAKEVDRRTRLSYR